MVTPELESVVPASERPVPMIALLIAPVPLPNKNPERVVEPVPPFATASVPANDPRVRQLPPIAKQPAVRFNPTFEVEVAEPRIERPVTVVVPKPVPETVSAEEEALVMASKILPVALPQMESLVYGVLVPIPTLPVETVAPVPTFVPKSKLPMLS